MKKLSILGLAVLACLSTSTQASKTQLYWGDTHLHTKLSPDAYLMKNRSLTPDDAYRYAKGLPVINALTKQMVKIQTPLDFLVVSEHAEYMGVVPKLFEGDPVLTKTDTGKKIAEMVSQGHEREAFLKLVASVNVAKPYNDINTPEIRQSVWQTVIESADRHYEPGKFTSFIGWEWSSLVNGENLHRIVFTKDNAEVAGKFLPYSMFDSSKPEDLWSWLSKTQTETGANFVSIPHNGNVSKGKMFAESDSDGKPLTASYARTRARWEPVYEMTQIKGDGETLPELSPNDEFADFEAYRHALDGRAGSDGLLPADKADYARTALMRGLEQEKKIGVNPFKFGMIGASDSHSGISAVEEDNFGGKFPIDSTPEGKKAPLTPGVHGYDMASAGLAGVWATENSREAIFDAFKRREVYATTGPRIQVRFFGGWEFESYDADALDIAKVGYQKGVPMGADLTNAPKNHAPKFLLQAVKDPIGAHLDRLQIVKGWLDKNGKAHEKVFNVLGSDGRKVVDNKLTAVGNTVDLATARYTNSIGDAQLATVWQDPEFDPSVRAFYYVRVLEIPTPRHTLYAAVAMNKPHQEGIPSTIQERAYSSPIWYTPAK